MLNYQNIRELAIDPEELISSLRQQPILIVIRPTDFQAADRQITKLHDAGFRHIEIAWTPNQTWEDWAYYWQEKFPSLYFGAASITCLQGLEAARRVGFHYSVSPILSETLLSHSRQLNMLLIPGVFSPTEVHKSIQLGCKMIKLFPAQFLGPYYWKQLSAPLGPLPFCLAAGGIQIRDVPLWLSAGVNAIALGQQSLNSYMPEIFSVNDDCASVANIR
ncbi:MAG TPA: bifunctional 4-hydroxy-2-oxoglutarate aldolase/2-dehydro-3-deoxy-phosphogluconate aldolase [Prochlorococcaceae cyanobacterium AMR_MDS_5431]|nr:bifunctional 4-hydroxy-2-oxoglutarate aldolase/2-dehydro-3-deoxy-phosphogluconate aldolase [Prochlorococcaceae cyanobacterium AMR_MDS_5431]